MLNPDHPDIARRSRGLLSKIKAQGVEGWLREGLADHELDTLIYLCKFAFFTGIVNKSGIKEILGADSAETRQLVRQWYNDHRERGCGTC